MSTNEVNSFNSCGDLQVGNATYRIFRLSALEKAGFTNISRLPFSMKVLLENLLRKEDNGFVKKADVEAVASWDPSKKSEKEIAFAIQGAAADTPDRLDRPSG